MSEPRPSSVHEQVLASMRALAHSMQREGVLLTMPPPSMLTLGTRYVELQPRKMLKAEIPFHDAFRNPTGVMQGGFLSACFDEVFGPLTYMVSRRPVATIHLETSFVRPFQASDEVLTVRADVVSASRALLLLKAEATRRDGKLIAIANAHCTVIGASAKASSGL